MTRRLSSLLLLTVSGCQLVVGSYSAGTAGDGGGPGAEGGATNDGGADAADATMPDGASEGGGQDGAVGPDADAGVDTGNLEAGMDGGAETGVPDASVCVPGTQRCSGGASVETCTAAGVWGAGWPCSTGMCAGGSCSGTTSGASNPSCVLTGDGMTDCGASAESCCTSEAVAGGSYDRTYAVGDGGAVTGLEDPASVSGFRLDAYLVTVGRFRQFVQAWNQGNARPPAGSGKHAHLNDQQGLVSAGTAGPAYESGWLASDDTAVAPTDSNLGSCILAPGDGAAPTYSTWTPSPDGQETLPINCVNWWEAYAFCIWDGGFLPSEAELEYAGAAGSQQRAYPWGPTDPGTANAYAIYGCFYPSGADGTCTSVANIAPVGSVPAGAGAWGQQDLAGDVFAWTLDWYAPYVDPCVDCAYLTTSSTRALRGGAFVYDEASLQPRSRDSSTPDSRNGAFGIRCARTP